MQRLWLISPCAAFDNPRWQGRPIWRYLVVRAESAAFARMEAEDYALGSVRKKGQVINESPSPVGGPKDVKLYSARKIPEKMLGIFLPEGRATAISTGILAAEEMTVSRPAIPLAETKMEEVMDDDEAIRRHAYELWQEAGCPEGRDEEFWEKAKELAGRKKPIDPIEAIEKQGDFPDVADKGE